MEGLKVLTFKLKDTACHHSKRFLLDGVGRRSRSLKLVGRYARYERKVATFWSCSGHLERGYLD